MFPRFLRSVVVPFVAAALVGPSAIAALCVDFTSTTFPAGANPRPIASADFNEDNKPDLALANGNVFLGDGAGGFTLATTLTLTGTPTSVAAGDVNGDGNADVIAAIDAGSGPNHGRLRVFLGNGNGTFGGALDTLTVFAPETVATGDFNGDTRTDLAYGWTFTSQSRGLTVVLGNANGTFTESSTTDGHPLSIQAAHLNADANLDLAVVSDTGCCGLKVLLGAGNGTFTVSQVTPVAASPRAVAVGDFNEDNVRDLAVAHAGGTVATYLGNGDGTYASPTSHAVASNPNFIATGDFNEDGFDDVATGEHLSILAGNGNATFDAHADFAATGTGALVVADFNSDGASDLAIATGTVLLAIVPCNHRPAITPAAAVDRAAGTIGSTATVATVSDVEDGAGSLTVSATSVPAGLTVTNIVNSGGTVTATIAATCSATAGAKSITFQVQDSGGKTSTASFTVNVSANPEPAIGTYADTSMGNSPSATVTPSAPPSDNGTFTVSAMASSGFTGTLSANQTTGAITINNPNSGTFTITVTVTDNCGAAVTRSFLLSATTLPFGAPQNLAATFQPGANSVFVSWTGTANVAHYEIWRRSSIAGWSFIGTTTNTWTHDVAPADAAYLYMVRGVTAAPDFSGFSNADLTVTYAFTDETILPGVTPVRLAHLTQLRTAADAALVLVGAPPFAWMETTPVVRAAEWNELRGAIDAVRANLGIGPVAYSEPLTAGATPIRAIHLMQARAGIR
jgi:FG-GAP-like repeat